MKLREAPMIYFSGCQNLGPFGILGCLSQVISKKNIWRLRTYRIKGLGQVGGWGLILETQDI
jgi:hypothetical protein